MNPLRNPNRRPTHPGAILRDDVVPALKMSQTEFAELLEVNRLSVSELLNGQTALSSQMAVRIGTLLNTSPESWLRMQVAIDFWMVQQATSKLSAVKSHV